MQKARFRVCKRRLRRPLEPHDRVLLDLRLQTIVLDPGCDINVAIHHQSRRIEIERDVPIVVFQILNSVCNARQPDCVP